MRHVNKGKLATVGVMLGCLLLLAAGSAGAEDIPWDLHRGEQIFHKALVGVEQEEGRLMLRWFREKPDPLAPNFTMSSCGKELKPSEANLRKLIGKPVYGWAAMNGREQVVYRLEFQCQ